MTSDLQRLARANPVAEPYDTDPSADDELLRRVLLEAAPPADRVAWEAAPPADGGAPSPPRAAVRRSRARARARRVLRARLGPRVLAPVALTLVALAMVALAPGGGTDPVGRLAGAERAYAAVRPGGDVIHEVVTSEWSASGKPGGREHYEAWYRPSTGQAVRITGGDEGAVRVMITRDGTVLVESADTSRVTGKAGLQPMTSPVTAGLRARNRRDFAAAFRAAYDQDELADRGLTTFDHRPAHRFEVVKGLDGIDALDYYADPETGRPLGSIERIGDQTNVRRLTTWERLDPNPVTLAKLDLR
jgi:hypothetical protein